MGRIKSTMVKKAARKVFEESEGFNDSFENNKKLLKGTVSYKSTRNKIAGEIVRLAKKRKQKDKAYVIGVNGIDGSGKTKFAESLETYLKAEGHQTQMIHLDDFHNPKAIRYAGKEQADNFYNKSFNINPIVEKLLSPIEEKKQVLTTLKLLDLNTDKYEIDKTYNVDQNIIVIFEGVFLFREELAPYIDYKVFLDIPFEESKKRAIIRDSEADEKKYDDKYLPAQKKYLEKFPPIKAADIIIDNTDWEYPKIKTISQE